MQNKGFTLIELMVVIAIIGILAMIASNFDFNKKTDVEKRDRFIQKLESIIHSNNITMLSGKGIKIGSDIINPTSTRIQFSTGSIGLYYYSGTTIVSTWEVLDSPFFWEKGYVINDIHGINKDSSTGAINSFPIEIAFENSDNTYFTGSDANTSSYVWIGMNVQYNSAKKLLEFDRRFGKITIK